MRVLDDSCRLCLKTRFLLTICSTDGRNTLPEKAKYCLDITLQKDDGLPMICEDCLKQLNNFYKFRKKCRSVDKKLKNKINHNVHCVDIEIKQENIDDSEDQTLVIKPDVFNKFEDNESWNVNNEKLEPNSILNFKAKSVKNNQNSVETNKILTSKAQTLQCEACGKIFKQKSIFKKHIDIHTGVKRFSCQICHKKFTRAEHVIVHMRAHGGVRPFICDVCARGFTKRQDLLRHMLIHSEEKKYGCTVCERKFKRSGDVNCHMRSHTGAKPYACSICNKKYSSHSGCKKHQRTHASNVVKPASLT